MGAAHRTSTGRTAPRLIRHTRAPVAIIMVAAPEHVAADEPPPPLAPQPGELSEREVDYTVAAQRGEVLRLGQPAVSADPDPEGPGPSSAPLKMAINAPTSRS